jgi:3-phosphoshikimate 1-carboxyvinyltransferase
MKTKKINRPFKINYVPPPDKSISHRALIFLSIARGKAVIENLSNCEDVILTKKALKKIGYKIIDKGNHCIVYGNPELRINRKMAIDCGESGTTIRLLSGLIAAISNKEILLKAKKSLTKRKMVNLKKALSKMNIKIKLKKEYPPIKILPSKIKNAICETKSAQVKSALLIAAIKSGKRITIKEKNETRTHSENILKYLGANLEKSNNKLTLKSSILKSKKIKVPGDLSSAIYFIAAAILNKGSKIEIKNTTLNEGRIGMLRILKKMNAKINWLYTKNKMDEIGNISAKYSPKLKAIKINKNMLYKMIDELPVLALIATKAEGTTEIELIKELKNKESDRIKATLDILNRLKIKYRFKDNILKIKGPNKLNGGFKHNGFNDHRILMTLFIAGLFTDKPIEIINSRNLKKSYPEFIKDLKLLYKNH